MTLKKQLTDELNRIASGGSRGTQTFAMDVDGGRLEADLTAVDQLACGFERLSFKTPRLENQSIDQLRKVADALAGRLSYLLESISPIETDNEGCVVQMRSQPPHKDDDGTSYYELVVRRGELSLCRFTKASGQSRRVIPAMVTREVFYRLAQDLSTALVQPS